MAEKSARYPALQYHDFRLLWFGQLLSNIGTQMQYTALNWHIYLLTDSAIALGLIGLARFVHYSEVSSMMHLTEKKHFWLQEFY